MKTVAVLLIMLALVSYRQANDSACSEAASEAGKLVVKFHGSDYVNLHVYQPSFYRQCVTAEVSNLSTQEATFSISEGALLTPDDPDFQKLIITKNEHIRILPHSSQKVQLYAMCTEADKGGSVPKTQFVLTGMAPEPWVKLAQLISKHNYQDLAGQSALWVLTDNHPQSEITSSDSAETYILRSYVAQAVRENSFTLIPNAASDDCISQAKTKKKGENASVPPGDVEKTERIFMY